MGMEFPTRAVFAGFWRRASAVSLDGLFFSTLLVPLLLVYGHFSPKAHNFLYSKSSDNSLELSLSLVFVILVSLFESSVQQATPGKILLGLKVTDARGARLSFMRAVWRNLARFAPLLAGFIIAESLRWLSQLVAPLSSLGTGLAIVALITGAVATCFPWISVPFSAKKQGIHDMLSDCLVLQGQKARAYVVFEKIWSWIVFLPIGALVLLWLVTPFAPGVGHKIRNLAGGARLPLQNTPAQAAIPNNEASDKLAEIEEMLNRKRLQPPKAGHLFNLKSAPPTERH